MRIVNRLATIAAFAAFNESITLLILDRIQRDRIGLAPAPASSPGAPGERSSRVSEHAVRRPVEPATEAPDLAREPEGSARES